MVEHKHKEFIIAWADGKIIQREVIDYEAEEGQHGNTYWLDDLHPKWDEDSKYRVKPEVVKPEWEHKEFDGDMLRQAYNSILGDSTWNSFNRSANKAVEIALEKGYVVLPLRHTTQSSQQLNVTAIS